MTEPSIQRLRSVITNWNQQTRTLGAIFVALAAVSLWASVVASAGQFVSQMLTSMASLLVISAMTGIVGFGLGTVAYTRYRGFELGMRWPRRDALVTAGLTVITPMALTLVVSAVGNGLFDVSLSLLAHRRISPNAGVEFVVAQVLPPAIFVGVGYGILVSGVVAETLRSVVASDDVSWIAALVIGFFWLLPIDTVARLPVTLGSAFELTVTLVFGVGFGLAVGTLYEAFETDAGVAAFTTGDWLLFVVAFVGVFGIVTGLSDISEVVVESLWIVALSSAAAGYLRTDSVWVAVATVAGFTVTFRLVIYAESVSGLVAF